MEDPGHRWLSAARSQPWPRDGAAHAALSLEALRGFRAWLRYSSIEVTPQGSGYRVIIRDARYARMARAPIGTRVVELDAELRALRISDRE